MVLYSKLPSLELSWLPISDRKTKPTPVIAFMDLDWCSACYMRRGDRHDEYESTGAKDVIVISTHWGGDIRPSSFAHEYRHMMQHYLLSLPSLPRLAAGPALDFGDTHDSWEKAIRTFYRSQPFEADALRYERKLAGDEQNELSFEAAFVTARS